MFFTIFSFVFSSIMVFWNVVSVKNESWIGYVISLILLIFGIVCHFLIFLGTMASLRVSFTNYYTYMFMHKWSSVMLWIYNLYFLTSLGYSLWFILKKYIDSDLIIYSMLTIIFSLPLFPRKKTEEHEDLLNIHKVIKIYMRYTPILVNILRILTLIASFVVTKIHYISYSFNDNPIFAAVVTSLAIEKFFSVIHAVKTKEKSL